MRSTLSLFLVFLLAGTLHAEARREADLTAAKKAMDAGQADTTIVLLHGSDWCVNGERVKANAWDQLAFSNGLPETTVLVAVDRLDRGTQGLKEAFQKQLQAHSPVGSKLSDVTTRHGSRFTERKNGIWQVEKDSPNPNQEVLTMTLRLDRPAQLLRFTTLPDPELPALGPGRATNGNFVVTEFEIRQAGQLVPLQAGDSFHQNNLPGTHACDGDLSNKNGWAVGARHEQHELYLVAEKPLPAGVNLEVTIHCLHSSVQHVPGKFKLEAFNHADQIATAQKWLDLAALEKRNQAMRVDGGNYPCLVGIDKDGRQFTIRQPLPADITPEKLATEVRAICKVRDQRDQLLTAAEKATGEAQLEAYTQAYLLMKKAGVGGFYRDIISTMVKLDPERKSAWTWRLSPDWGWVNSEQNRLTKEEGFPAVLDFLNQLRGDPRLKRFTPDQQQDFLMRKFHIYRSWHVPKDWMERFRKQLSESKSVAMTETTPLCKQGTRFGRRDDGSWQVEKGSPNPATEVITLKFKLQQPASLLQFTTLPDAELPATGPGRPGNGNYVVTEVELRQDSQKISLGAFATYEQGDLPAWQTTDGDLSNRNGWAIGGQHKPHELSLVPRKPLPAGVELELTIHCTSVWAQHVPGKFKLSAFNNSEATELAKRLARHTPAYLAEQRSKRFDVLREIIAIDPMTHLGIGAKGYIDAHSEGDPSIAFGWKPGHLLPGQQTLDIREGVDNYFFKPAIYRVTISTQHSARPVKVKSLALVSGDRELSRDAHEATLAVRADKDNVFQLELPEGIDRSTLLLRVELEVPEGHNHTAHGFRVTPTLPDEGEFGWW